MKKTKRSRSASDADVAIGKQLRVLREAQGVSQMKLAEKVGVSYQQIQKYETGLNRISAGKLYEFSRGLGIPLHSFFIGLNDNIGDESSSLAQDVQAIELFRLFKEIRKPEIKEKLLDLMREIVKT